MRRSPARRQPLHRRPLTCRVRGAASDRPMIDGDACLTSGYRITEENHSSRRSDWLGWRESNPARASTQPMLRICPREPSFSLTCHRQHPTGQAQAPARCFHRPRCRHWCRQHRRPMPGFEPGHRLRCADLAIKQGQTRDSSPRQPYPMFPSMNWHGAQPVPLVSNCRRHARRFVPHQGIEPLVA